MKLYLKGERCFSEKCAISRRPEKAPGEHGGLHRKVTDFGVRLREKQKVKRMYGLTENQFRRFFDRASRSKGVTGERLISLLESRLDNVVYRLGFASSRNDARQLVRSGHVMVNGRTVDIPSYTVEPGDTVEIKPKSHKLDRINIALEGLARRGLPDWLELDAERYRGTVRRAPLREDVTIPIEEQLIVEYYSKV